jgi:hypothetical protein
MIIFVLIERSTPAPQREVAVTYFAPRSQRSCVEFTRRPEAFRYVEILSILSLT